jgi:hypothetical protein
MIFIKEERIGNLEPQGQTYIAQCISSTAFSALPMNPYSIVELVLRFSSQSSSKRCEKVAISKACLSFDLIRLYSEAIGKVAEEHREGRFDSQVASGNLLI